MRVHRQRRRMVNVNVAGRPEFEFDGRNTEVGVDRSLRHGPCTSTHSRNSYDSLGGANNASASGAREELEGEWM